MNKKIIAMLISSAFSLNVSAQQSVKDMDYLQTITKQNEKQSYVVKFKSASVLSLQANAKKQYNLSIADKITNLFNVEFDRAYHSAFFGGVLTLTQRQADLIEQHPLVESVIKNSVTQMVLPPAIPIPAINKHTDISSTNNVLSWGLDRIDQLAMPLDDSYEPPYTGEGVTVYIMDSGVQADHPDLVGRIAYTRDTYNNTNDAFDWHGHGTHVLGTVGSEKYGVAKDATLVMIRPFKNNCGAGTVESFLGAIDFIKQDAA